VGGGKPFTVVVTHFTSKNCDPNSSPENPGPGRRAGLLPTPTVWSRPRHWSRSSTRFRDDVAIVGDLNSYGEEDPIDVLEAAATST
jgi:predicted extracellular nuclease